GPVRVLSTPVNFRRTSADAVGLRASLPLKITSSIRSPRRLFALCSPITHVMASATLLLPHPFGPTMAVTPLSKASSERSEKDLKPWISRRSRRMSYTTGMEIGCRRFGDRRLTDDRRLPISTSPLMLLVLTGMQNDPSTRLRDVPEPAEGRYGPHSRPSPSEPDGGPWPRKRSSVYQG